MLSNQWNDLLAQYMPEIEPSKPAITASSTKNYQSEMGTKRKRSTRKRSDDFSD